MVKIYILWIIVLTNCVIKVDQLKKLFLADGWTMEKLPRGWLGKGTIHQV